MLWLIVMRVTKTLYLSSCKVFCVLLLTGGGEKHNVIDGLDQLQLHDALYEQGREQALLLDLCRTRQEMVIRKQIDEKGNRER